MTRKCVFLLIFCCAFDLGAFAAALTTPAQPALWYFHSSYLTSQSAVTSSEQLIDEAYSAGYTGLVLWDSAIDGLNVPGWNASYLEQVAQYAESKGMKVVPYVARFGWSQDNINQDVNGAESIGVTGTQYQVSSDGTTLNRINSSPGYLNPGFELGQVDWFSYNDAGVSLSTTVAHTGHNSGLIQNAPVNARFFQTVNVIPHRQYHIQMWVQTTNFGGYPSIYLYDHSNWGITRINEPIPVQSNQGWTEYDWAFNSQSSTAVDLLFGIWGGSSGDFYVDDILFEETGLVFVVQGASAPLSLYLASSPNTTFTQGADFNQIVDTQMVNTLSFWPSWHTPPTVTIPKGSRLTPNEIVAINYYAVQPCNGGQVSMSMQDPTIVSWLQTNATLVAQTFPQAGGIMLGYDEMRQAGSDGMAVASGQTAGQILAASVKQVAQMYASKLPKKPVYVWNDMFDPYQNAIANYYLVPTTYANSWQGIPPLVRIMNWNLKNVASLQWFAGLNSGQPIAHQQMIAGFYDSSNATTEAQAEMAAAAGVPGIQGAMYTTWTSNYSQLSAYAAAIKAAWPAYLNSLQNQQ